MNFFKKLFSKTKTTDEQGAPVTKVDEESKATKPEKGIISPENLTNVVSLHSWTEEEMENSAITRMMRDAESDAVDVENDDAFLVIQSPIELDAKHAGSFKDYLRVVMEKHARIVVDFSGTVYMDSAGLGVIVSAGLTATKQRKEFLLSSINDEVYAIFELTRLNKTFKIFGSLEEIKQKYGVEMIRSNRTFE